uniref:Uncharacterized protein n=1 Tax=Glossina palpalis gambiensis TaxID=67801 RepID=A0A1B0BYT7_9MUSC
MEKLSARSTKAVFNKTTRTISKKLRVYEYRESSFSMKTLSWHIKKKLSQIDFGYKCIFLQFVGTRT